MDCMKSDILIKVVADFYTDKEVKDAKNDLFKHFPDMRNVKRAGDSKREMNVKDILEVLHSIPGDSCDEKSLKFVTESCHFPSLELKDIDTFSMLEEFCSLKKEVLLIRNNSSEKKILEQMSELRCMVSQLSALVKRQDTRHKGNFVSKQKVTDADGNNLSAAEYVDEAHEGTDKDAKECTSSAVSYADIMKSSYPSNTKANLQLETNKLLSYPDDWQKVKKKVKKPSKSLVGKLKGGTLKCIQSQRRPADIFISRLHPATTAAEVKSFVSAQFKSAKNVSCSQLKTKYDTYASFYVQIDGITFSESLNLDNWPEGLLVKRFYNRNVSNAIDDSNTTGIVNGGLKAGGSDCSDDTVTDSTNATINDNGYSS